MGKYNFNIKIDRTDLHSLKESMTPKEVREHGLISYWGAEFEFPTCPAFSEGVIACAKRGHYPFTIQDENYNQHVAWWMKNMRHWTIEHDWIVPTHGTIFALATAIRLFVKQGQNMIVILPGYSRYKQAADRIGVGCVASYMKCRKEEGHYELDWTDLEQKMACPENTLLVLCNPNNPTGMILREDELKRISELSLQYNVPIFCDEIFAEVVFDGGSVVPYSKAAGTDSLSITCTSLGKCMSLTGVNHANVIIPNSSLREKYINQKYSDHYGSIDPMLYAGLCGAYSEDGKEYVEELCGVIKKNVELFTTSLNKILPKAKVIQPEGTYVVWVDYSGMGLSDQELAEFLEKKALFFGDPGSEYGANDQYYRYNLAVPMECLRQSMEYLKITAKNTILQTERLILRKFKDTDMEALYLLLHDEEVNRFLPWFPVKSIDETKCFYETRFASKEYAFAICLKEDNLPIGYIKADTDESHDFGYALRKEFWHRGIVTEAGNALVTKLKEDGIPYITATHDRNNPRSGGVMRQIGMKYCYSYEEQWQPKDFPVTFRMYQLNLDGQDGSVYRKYWDLYEKHMVEDGV